MAFLDDKEIIRYYDPRYTSSWVPHEFAEKVSNILMGLINAKVMDAGEIREAIIGLLDEGRARKSVLIFTQDVFPDTVFRSNTPDVLIRHYMENGGTIIWYGDIPFWYRGKRGIERAVELPRDSHSYRWYAPTNILGVIPFMTYSPTDTVEITWKGKILGLEYRWQSHRPIYYPGKDIIALAKSRPLISWPVQYIKQMTIKRSIWDRVRRIRVGGFEVEGEPVIREEENVGEGMSVEERGIYFTYKELISGWVKKYGAGRFIRLLDLPFGSITHNEKIENYYANLVSRELQ